MIWLELKPPQVSCCPVLQRVLKNFLESSSSRDSPSVEDTCAKFTVMFIIPFACQFLKLQFASLHLHIYSLVFQILCLDLNICFHVQANQQKNTKKTFWLSSLFLSYIFKCEEEI